MESLTEYPRFYRDHILGKLQTRPLSIPVGDALSADVVTVTGEHGDQLFGSDHLASIVRAGLGHLPYRDVVPYYVTTKLKRPDDVAAVMEYLEPQIASAPVEIITTFDYLWWCNFSLKWSQVSLRIPAFRGGNIAALYQTTRHFFADPQFQSWSLSNPQVRLTSDWRSYKLEAKKVILEATGDLDYFATKEKEASLKHVLVDRSRQGADRYRVHVYDDFDVHLESFHKDLRV